MSKLITSTALAITLLVASHSATAADRPDTNRQEVPAAALAHLGLAGLQPIGDRQGHTIRGRAFIGTPGNGPFTTLPTILRKDGLGVIEHGFIKGTQTTTIVNHPQFGTITLPPQLQK